MANHHIVVEFNRKNFKIRAVVWTEPEQKNVLGIAESYHFYECMEAIRQAGIETVGYVEMPELTDEHLAYWGMDQCRLNDMSESERVRTALTPIYKNGDVIMPGSEHEHVYGDELLIDAICEDRDMTFAQFNALSLGEQHSIQYGWVC